MYAGPHICVPLDFLPCGRDAVQGALGSPGTARDTPRAVRVDGEGLGARARGSGTPALEAAAWCEGRAPPAPRRPRAQLPGCWRLCRAGGRGLSPTLGCRVCGPLSTEPGGDRGHAGLARSGRGAGWHSHGVGLTVRPPAPLTGSSRSLQTGGRGGPSGAAVHRPSPRVPASSLRSSRPPKPRAQTRLPRVCRPALWPRG